MVERRGGLAGSGTVRPVTSTDSTTEPICAVGQGRFARWRAVGAALLTLLGLVLVPPLLVQAGVVGDGWLMPAFFAHFAAVVVYMLAIIPRRPEMRGRMLTARTWSGRCTVDLDRLVRVRRLVVLGKNTASTLDWLMLVDGHGVRLAVQAPRQGETDYAERAIARTALAPPNGVRVSRWARKRLRPAEHRPMSCLLAGLAGLVGAVLGLAVAGGTAVLLLAFSIQLGGEG